MATTKTKLEYALEYAARGWRVMPLHNIEQGRCTCHKMSCSSAAKHPRILDPLIRATVEEKQIREWWDMWPNANPGIATGSGSGCVVLDVDAGSGGVESLKAILEQHGELTGRAMARTGGGGFHLYFAHPGGNWPNTQGTPTRPSPIGQGLDFRGDGGLVAAPGSDHLSGKVYAWTNPPNGHLPEAPKWLLERLQNRKSTFEMPADGDSVITGLSRHNTLRAWACQMRGKGMSKAAIRAALVTENAARFETPKPDDEVDRLIEWVGKFNPGDVPDWRNPLEEKPADAPLPVGLVSIRDIQAEMDALYHEGAKRGLLVGWPSLDELYSVHQGDITVMCAAPSAGKTTLGLNLIANMAVTHDWKIAVCSTENKASMMLADLAGMIAGATYYGNFRQDRMDLEMKEYVDNFIYEHFRLVSAVNDEPFTLEYVLSHAKAMNADGVMVDPFGALVLPQKGNSNDSRVIRDLLHNVAQPFVKETGLHLWLMVHTTKLPVDSSGDIQMPNPYNATDSAGFYNAADFFLGMRRPKSKGGQTTEVAVQKVRDRFSGAVGQCQFTFDFKTGRYFDAGLIEEASSLPESDYAGSF